MSFNPSFAWPKAFNGKKVGHCDLHGQLVAFENGKFYISPPTYLTLVNIMKDFQPQLPNATPVPKQ
jgi:hypothetical protein